jgi:AcrR family transcriptional regulator
MSGANLTVTAQVSSQNADSETATRTSGSVSERVVDEAAALADEVGLERLTLSAIAARVGVAQPSLYKHVSGLPAVRRALALRGVRELYASLLRATAGRARSDALFALAHAYRAYAHDHQGCYEASIVAPEPGDHEHTAASEEILGVVSAVLPGYGITGADAVDAIRALRAALHGYVVLERAGGYRMPRDVDRSFERLVSMLDDALTNWTADSQEDEHR